MRNPVVLIYALQPRSGASFLAAGLDVVRSSCCDRESIASQSRLRSVSRRLA